MKSIGTKGILFMLLLSAMACSYAGQRATVTYLRSIPLETREVYSIMGACLGDGIRYDWQMPGYDDTARSGAECGEYAIGRLPKWPWQEYGVGLRHDRAPMRFVLESRAERRSMEFEKIAECLKCTVKRYGGSDVTLTYGQSLYYSH